MGRPSLEKPQGTLRSFQSHQSAQGVGNANRASSVAAQRQGRLAGGHCRSGASTGASRHPFRVPGIAGVSVVGGFPGGTVSQRIHIQLAQ